MDTRIRCFGWYPSAPCMPGDPHIVHQTCPHYAATARGTAVPGQAQRKELLHLMHASTCVCASSMVVMGTALKPPRS